MPDTPQLQAQLAALEARFRQRLDDELDTLDDLSAQLQTDPSALQSLRDRLHKRRAGQHGPATGAASPGAAGRRYP